MKESKDVRGVQLALGACVLIFAVNQGVDPGYCVVPADLAEPSDAKE